MKLQAAFALTIRAGLMLYCKAECYTRPMALTRDEVLHIARLARVGLTEEDVTKFQQQLSLILDHFDALSRIDTEGVPPTTHTLDLEGVMAPDEPQPSLPKDAVLANAPLDQDGYLRVRAVLDT